MALPFSSADMARQLGHGGKLSYIMKQFKSVHCPSKKIGTLQFQVVMNSQI
jgi:hypothetical protein